MGFVDNVDNGVIGLERDKNHILYKRTVVTARTSRAHAQRGSTDFKSRSTWSTLSTNPRTHGRLSLAGRWSTLSTRSTRSTHGRHAPVGRWSTWSTRPRGQGDGTDGMRLLADGPHGPHGRAAGRPPAPNRHRVFGQGGGGGPAAGRSRQRRGHKQFFLLKIFAIFGPCSKPCHMNRVNCAQPRIA